MSRQQSSSKALVGWSNDERVPMSSIVAGRRHKNFISDGEVRVGDECIQCRMDKNNRYGLQLRA